MVLIRAFLIAASLAASSHSLATELVNVKCNADLLCLKVYKGKRVEIFLENKTHKPLSFKLFLTTDNLNYVREETLTLSEPATTRIASFKTPSGRWGYEYRTHYGHDRHVHDDDYVYTLPYAPGSTYTVSQNHANLLTHHDGNRYAIDWSMPIGDPVHAARGGIVVSTYQLAGSERVEASATANHIWIQHSDGTIGKYLHLDHDGVLVEEGEIVSPGQHIGSSGNTGFSSGPHLHFSVSTLDGESLYQSFNVRFKTSVGPGYIEGEGPYLHSQ